MPDARPEWRGWRLSPRSFRVPARRLLASLLLAAPALPYLAIVPHFGRLPYDDYYWVLAQITEGDGFSAHPVAWLSVRSNEHLVVLPAAVYALNVVVTRGDNRGLSAFALALLIVVLATLVAMLPAELRRCPLATLALGAAFALFVFTPAAAHNVVKGYSGTAWFLSNVCAVGAIAVMGRAAAAPGRVWWVGGLGIAGALSYSTNLVLWPSLIVGSWLLGLRRRQLAALSGLGALVWVLQAATYVRVEGHPPPRLEGVEAFGRSVASYLGSPLAVDASAAARYGVGIAIVSGLAIVTVLVRHGESARRLLAPWIALQVYAGGNAIVTAIFRSSPGDGPEHWGRYASVPALFWIGAIGVTGLLVWIRRPATPAVSAGQRIVWALAIASLALPMSLRGREELRELLARAGRQPAAAQALVADVWDGRILEAVTRYPEEVRMVRDFMRHAGHVPFDAGVGTQRKTLQGNRTVPAGP